MFPAQPPKWAAFPDGAGLATGGGGGTPSDACGADATEAGAAGEGGADAGKF